MDAERVRQKAAARHWADHGPAGFAIGSNHTINDAVPAENLRALARAVAELRAGA